MENTVSKSANSAKAADLHDLERLLKAAYRTMTEEEVARFWRFVQWVVCSIASTIYWAAWSPLRI
jgi:hypothetical protein